MFFDIFAFQTYKVTQYFSKMRYQIRLSYNGEKLCGWQIQPNDTTVQGEIEKALMTLLRIPVSITGAGRTDSGVNAINYIAHFDLPDEKEIDAAHLCYKLNAILPHEIVIHEVSSCNPEFHYHKTLENPLKIVLNPYFTTPFFFIISYTKQNFNTDIG